MKRHHIEFFKIIIKKTAPIFFGYFAIGFAYGLLVENSGYPTVLAPLMSLFIYAGAAQFMIIGFFTANTGITEILSLVFLINSRHIVYGLSFIKKYSINKWFKPYLIFSLTDETYGLLTGSDIPNEHDNPKFYFYVSLFNHLYWIFGTTIGVIFGHFITFNLKGLDFALTALFIVLLIEQLKNKTSKIPFLIAFVSGLICLIFIGGQNMLLISVVLSISILILFRRILENDES